VIVVNYRSAALVTRLVESLAGSVEEMIVLDNSGELDGEGLEAIRGGVRVERMPGNVGYGAAANRGAALASGDVLVVCNPDIIVDTADLDRLVAVAGEDGVGMAAPRFTFKDGSLQRSAHRREPGLVTTVYELCYPLSALLARLAPGWHPTLHPAAAHEHRLDASHVLGALMVMPARVFADVGGFDEGFFLYREETDLCRRLRAAGWRTVHAPAGRAVHESGGSTTDGLLTQTRPAYLDSHYRYIAKHRGRAVAVLARVLGLVGATVWWALGPRRADAARILRWHVGRR
jgi:GT2 family glycosyltransferase